MKHISIILFLSIFIVACNNNEKQINHQTNSLSQKNDSCIKYYSEANKLYTYILDSLRPMENTIIYDTLYFFEDYNGRIIQEVLQTIDSLFPKSEGLYMINNYNSYKNTSIYNIIQEDKYRMLIKKVYSVNNKRRFFLSPEYSNTKIRLLISAPMFNKDYTKSLTYIVSYYYKKGLNYVDITINGTYIYLKKVKDKWQRSDYIYEQSPFNISE